jgi:hypothetical protein
MESRDRIKFCEHGRDEAQLYCQQHDIALCIECHTEDDTHRNCKPKTLKKAAEILIGEFDEMTKECKNTLAKCTKMHSSLSN